ncbi:MAG: short-chain dehydrogenase, partial [Burkholderiaceae bacterium]
MPDSQTTGTSQASGVKSRGVALVTGGARRLGRAIALELAAQ